MPLRFLDDPADLDRYLDLREERERVDAELAALAPVILEALEAEDDGRAEARGFVLSAKVRRSYRYPQECADVARYLREIQAAARADGSAAVDTVTGYVEARRSRPSRADVLLAVEAEARTALAAAA